jgi:hypothetical protein
MVCECVCVQIINKLTCTRIGIHYVRNVLRRKLRRIHTLMCVCMHIYLFMYENTCVFCVFVHSYWNIKRHIRPSTYFFVCVHVLARVYELRRIYAMFIRLHTHTSYKRDVSVTILFVHVRMHMYVCAQSGYKLSSAPRK